MPSTIRGSDDFETEKYRSLQDRTWQDVSGSRSPGVVYTNTTGIEIEVHASCRQTSSGNSQYAQITIDGEDLKGSSNYGSGLYGYAAVQATVPNGSTYEVKFFTSGSITDRVWKELR